MNGAYPTVHPTTDVTALHTLCHMFQASDYFTDLKGCSLPQWGSTSCCPCTAAQSLQDLTCLNISAALAPPPPPARSIFSQSLLSILALPSSCRASCRESCRCSTQVFTWKKVAGDGEQCCAGGKHQGLLSEETSDRCLLHASDGVMTAVQAKHPS